MAEKMNTTNPNETQSSAANRTGAEAPMTETTRTRKAAPAAERTEKKEKSSHRKKQKGLLCDEMSFAAAEAYKMLRTNLLFTLPGQETHIIGVTSSLRGEGKSTTAVNLAFTLGQTGKRVLLIDGDMRLPTIAQKLDMAATPGLSNLLAGLNTERECLRKSSYFDNWYILPAGDVPPNPSELLGSERMHALLDRYREVFDYILIDLPPVNIVVDALVVTQWMDGIVVVVRENYTDRRALNSCMYQVEKLGSKMLGFIMTDAKVGSSSYKHYGKYGKRYGGYDYGYGYDKRKKGDAPPSKKKTQAFLDATSDESTAFGDDEK